MILTDAGPLIALLTPSDPYHARCAALERSLQSEAMLTTWVCFTEAMYFLGETGGYRLQEALWNLQRNGRLGLHILSEPEMRRMQALMEQYRDTPMDLADASLIAVAESLGLRQVFTTDSDFYVYRLTDGSAMEVVHRPG